MINHDDKCEYAFKMLFQDNFFFFNEILFFYSSSYVAYSMMNLLI